MENQRNRVLVAICQGREEILEKLYQEEFPVIENFVIKNNGNKEDARDLFHDAMMVIFQKSRNKDFDISCNFSTYLYAVCKNLWLKELRRKKNFSDVEIGTEIQSMEGQEEVDDMMPIRKKLFLRNFSRLSAKCQEVLKLTMGGMDVEEIKSIMEFSSLQHTMNRKYRCKKALMELIQKDPGFWDAYS